MRILRRYEWWPLLPVTQTHRRLEIILESCFNCRPPPPFSITPYIEKLALIGSICDGMKDDFGCSLKQGLQLPPSSFSSKPFSGKTGERSPSYPRTRPCDIFSPRFLHSNSFTSTTNKQNKTKHFPLPKSATNQSTLGGCIDSSIGRGLFSRYFEEFVILPDFFYLAAWNQIVETPIANRFGL